MMAGSFRDLFGFVYRWLSANVKAVPLTLRSRIVKILSLDATIEKKLEATSTIQKTLSLESQIERSD